jgi:hypothetical protein
VVSSSGFVRARNAVSAGASFVWLSCSLRLILKWLLLFYSILSLNYSYSSPNSWLKAAANIIGLKIILTSPDYAFPCAYMPSAFAYMLNSKALDESPCTNGLNMAIEKGFH